MFASEGGSLQVIRFQCSYVYGESNPIAFKRRKICRNSQKSPISTVQLIQAGVHSKIPWTGKTQPLAQYLVTNTLLTKDLSSKGLLEVI